MDDIGDRQTHTVSIVPNQIIESHERSSSSNSDGDVDDKKRHCVSLPMYYDQVSCERSSLSQSRSKGHDFVWRDSREEISRAEAKRERTHLLADD